MTPPFTNKPLPTKNSPSAKLPSAEAVRRQVEGALAEDIGGGDLSAGVLPARARVKAVLVARGATVLCGGAWFAACFAALDSRAEVRWFFNEGDDVPAGARVAEVRAQARAVMAAERAALNFLQTLSGTAAAARALKKRLPRGARAVLTDTRKTLPLLRAAQKYAVAVGGGVNHRHGLFDGVLLKENHLRAAGGMAAAFKKARQNAPASDIQIEARNLREVRAAAAAGARRILLDNFSLAQLREAAAFCATRGLESEASGNITAANIGAVARTGVSRISCGALTKNVNAADYSLLVSMPAAKSRAPKSQTKTRAAKLSRKKK